jgi:hypothetical protein
VPGLSAEELAAHFGRKYDAPVRVLPKLPITNEMRQPNTPHGTPAAGAMIAAIAAAHPKLARNTESIFIFVTEEMTVEQAGNRRFNFFLDLEGRFGILAAEALRPTNYCEPADDALLEARLRKVLTRAIGTLYFRLPRSDDPRSVLYNSVGCVDELDFQGEDF